MLSIKVTVEVQEPGEGAIFLAALDEALRAVAPREPQRNGHEPQEPACPRHGEAYLRQGKWGLFCAGRLEDGSWCTWKPAREKAKARKGRGS